MVGNGTYVGYEAGRDGGGGVRGDGGGRSCIVAVQGDQARWFKELWFEKQYKICKKQKRKGRFKQERRENSKRMKRMVKIEAMKRRK